MAFRIGQKVVCVDSEPSPGMRWTDNEPPKLGTVYTVVGFGFPLYGQYEVIKVAGLRCPLGYRAHRFRPLTERSTEAGMSILKRVAREASRSRENV